MNYFLYPSNIFSKQQLLLWLNQFKVAAFFDSNHYKDEYSEYDFIAFADTINSLHLHHTNYEQLQQFIKSGNWYYGHINFEFHELTHKHSVSDITEFDLLAFEIPKYVIYRRNNAIYVHTKTRNEADELVKHISSITLPNLNQPVCIKKGNKKSAQTAADYKQVFSQIQQHLQQGNCYEINYCINFLYEDTVVDVIQAYQQLQTISPNPFSCFYKQQHKYLLCASPERFLKKINQTILAQPIKGTAKRNFDDAHADELAKQALQLNAKERSENVMIVDLMRNDLSRIARKASVQVKELCGIYSYPQVHQMISTVVANLDSQIHVADIIKNTFPMGSMTGAPKTKVLELITLLETTQRGIFSGSVGFIKPNTDFDLNVVIRSIMYNSQKQTVSFKAGSGITIYANAEQEYEECLLKISALEKILN